jgi:hypothetical protein
MNCREGDLALIVRNTSRVECIGNIIGSPVTVTRLLASNAYGLGPLWQYEGKLRCPNCGGQITRLLDADLQPLRPAPHETVRQIIAGLTA